MECRHRTATRCPRDGCCGALEARREPRLMPFVETWPTSLGTPAPCAPQKHGRTSLQNGAPPHQHSAPRPGKAFHDGTVSTERPANTRDAAIRPMLAQCLREDCQDSSPALS